MAYCKENTVFGQPNVADSNIRSWLEMLRQAEPESRRGEFMLRNLLEDANVCPALQQQFRDFVAAEPAAATADQATEQFQRFLQDVRQPDPPCQHPDNLANRLPDAPFVRLARAVDGEAFLRFNYLPTVLDAGWWSSAIAFLPSAAATPQPGRTQDLTTGQPAEPEVLHAVFPAAQIQRCIIAGPFRRDPSDKYKAIRLGTGANPAS